MDPKALAGLDPKLRETYEKVMGTSTSPSPRTADSTNSAPPSRTSTLLPGLLKTQTQPSPTTPAPASPSLPNIPPPSNPPAPNNSTQPPSAVITQPAATLQSPVQVSDFATLQSTPTGAPLPAQSSVMQLGKQMQPLPSPAQINKGAEPSSQSSPLIRALYIVASIIFFAVYTIFWLKILKYPIPFLPF